MTFIDFFAGIGGFTAGLTQAGMKCVGYCERDKYAVNSYRAIHKPNESEMYSDDITKLESTAIPHSDGWTAGFPCQDISIVGRRTGLGGRRSGLFFEIVRLLGGKAEEDRPEWLLFENVKNLLSVNNGYDFTEILYSLSEIGYHCEWDCINAKSYVPQNRERVFIVGHSRSERCGKVFPVGEASEQTIKQIKAGRQGDRIMSADGIAASLVSTGGGNGGKTGLYRMGNSRIRRLTPLECFRLQGFTDEQFYAAQNCGNSDNQLYKQAGNGVCVPVVRAIGEKLIKIYKE